MFSLSPFLCFSFSDHTCQRVIYFINLLKYKFLIILINYIAFLFCFAICISHNFLEGDNVYIFIIEISLLVQGAEKFNDLPSVS